MWLSWTRAALCLLHLPVVIHLATASLVQRATPLPSPISFPPAQNWDGADGKWSTFTLRVGTPAQNVRVLISTASQSTWLVLPQGCDENDSSCQDNRGGTFDYNSSSTWALQGSYPLSTESSLPFHDDDGLWGNDTLGLGIQGGGGPTLNKQVIAGVTTKDIYVGMFGVNPKPSDYNGEQHDSYMTSLKKQDLIPSLTFGYTAGASYRLKHVLGSLTLGGYDRSLFVPNAHSFSFAPDRERELLVGLQRIDYTSTGNTSSLLPKGIRASIDSTTPFLYLPPEACKAFEQAFNLEYNATMELYPVSSSLHADLIAQNASITFALGDDTSGGEIVNITLPYDSFDLTAESPVVEGSTKFFPLKRAVNETQYTLGRTFLQEAYLIVDYERKNFSISQCTFEDGSTQDLVSISPAAVSNTTSPGGIEPSSRNSTTIIGVAVGVSVLAMLIVAGGVSFYLVKKRRARQRAKELKEEQEKADQEAAEKIKQGSDKVELGTLDHTRWEIGGSEVQKPLYEADGPPVPSLINEKANYFDGRIGKPEFTSSDTKRAELPTYGAPFYELGESSAAPVELPADMPARGTPPQSVVASPFSDPPTQPSSRNSGSPRPPSQPSPIETQTGHLPTRSSTLDSIGFAPSSPSLSGPSSPTDRSRHSGTRSESVYSPISPIRSSEGGTSPTDGGPSPATPSPGSSNRGRRSPHIAASSSDDSRRRERRRKDETG